jgi:uncharacterized heparinase superfamily protein
MTDILTRDALRDAGAEDTHAIPLGSGGEHGVLSDNEDGRVEAAAPPPVPSEFIEPGRALALTDFAPPAIGAGERLIRLAYRLGIPATMLTAPVGKAKRLRLKATVVNPLAGDPVSGTALRAGHFLVFGARTPIAQIDFAGAARMTPPLEAKVHSFAWLADLEACAPREQVAPVADRILRAWLDANPKIPSRPGKGPAWTVGYAGARLLAWLIHAPLILAGDDSAFRTRMLDEIAATARWLDRNVRNAEDPLAEVTGWCGIVAAGLMMPDGRPRRLFGEAGLIRALGELVGEDGGVLSRSPLAQMEAIAVLTRLRACYDATGHDCPDALQNMLAHMVPPLLALAHGDGALGSWQGGWAISADTIGKLVAASKVRTRPLRDVRQWGYQRVVAQKGVLLFDAAPPPLARQARNGCAATLAFEFSHGANRIVVNCGGSGAAGGLLPIRLEQGLRATAAHSTLVLDDANSTAVLLGGRIGLGVTEVDIDRRTVDLDNGGHATRLEACHDGYAYRYGLTHRRILIMRDDGTELRGEDMLVPTGRKGQRGKVGYAIRFHLGTGIELGRSADGQGVGLALPDGSRWQFRTNSGEVVIEDSLWVDGDGRPVPVHQIVLQGMVSRGGGNFAWILKKMG